VRFIFSAVTAAPVSRMIIPKAATAAADQLQRASNEKPGRDFTPGRVDWTSVVVTG